MCAVCGQDFPVRDLVAGGVVRDVIYSEIHRDHPDWSPQSYICREDLTTYRSAYVHSLLQSEKGDLSHLEQGVIQSLRDHELITRNVDADYERSYNFV